MTKTVRRGEKPGAGLDVDVPVARVMVEHPLCVGPDVSGVLARLLMLESGVGALPVIDDVGRLVGMISKTDVMRDVGSRRAGDTEPELLAGAFASEFATEEASLHALGVYVENTTEPKVRELMAVVTYTATPEMSVRAAARLMVEHDVHHLPVVGARGELVGMLSPFDFVRAVARLESVTPQSALRRSS